MLAVAGIIGLLVPFFLYKSVLAGSDAGACGKLVVVFNRAAVAFAFVVIGQLIRPQILHYNRIRKEDALPTALLGLAAFVLTAGAAVVNLKITGNDIYNGVIGNPLTLFVGGVSGTVMMLDVARVVNPKVCRKIGRHTLTIMGTHQIIIYVVTSRLPAMENNVVLAIVLLVTIAVLEVPVVWIVDRKLPFLVGRKKMS